MGAGEHASAAGLEIRPGQVETGQCCVHDKDD